MSNRHLIAKQSLEIRIAGKTEAHSIQQEISALYWQKVAPAFEQLFNRLVGPDEIIRLGRVEINLGVISLQDLLSDDFLKKLIIALETAITKEKNTPVPDTVVQPLRIGRFDLWLYFLEHGSLPAYAVTPESIPEWRRHIFDTLALEQHAVDQLRQLIATYPRALERLVLQYDAVFLQQIITLFTGFKHDKLSIAIQEIITLIGKSEGTKASTKHREELSFKQETERIVNAVLGQLLVIFPFLQSDIARQEVIKKKLTRLFNSKITGSSGIRQTLANPEVWQEMLGAVITTTEQETALIRLMEIQGSRFGKRKSPTRKNEKTSTSVFDKPLIQSEIDALWIATAAYFTRPELQQLLRQIDEMLTLIRLKKNEKTGKDMPAAAPFSAKTQRLFEIEAWRIILDVTIVRRQKAETPDLIAVMLQHKSMQQWQLIVLKSLEKLKRRQTGILSDLAPKLKAASMTTANDRVQKQEDTPSVEQQTNTLSKKEDTFFILEAGLVLLHPFLGALFRKMDLLEGPAFKDNQSQQKAVCLLHFLATGASHTPEYQLTLPKLLCGLPLNMPIDHTITISPEEQPECGQLLSAAIEHWEVLGATSPDGLREGFLQREGKLSKEQKGWLLRVERKTLDILLDRLPWSIGMIKLPWMEEVLIVDWT